jgi:hypothetical protein
MASWWQWARPIPWWPRQVGIGRGHCHLAICGSLVRHGRLADPALAAPAWHWATAASVCSQPPGAQQNSTLQ